MIQLLDNLLYLLNSISVRGKEDITRMQACIKAVEKLKDAYTPHSKQEDAKAPE